MKYYRMLENFNKSQKVHGFKINVSTKLTMITKV